MKLFRLTQAIKSIISQTAQTPGSQRLSLVFRQIFEISIIKQIYGANLVAAVFLIGVVTPTTQQLFDWSTVKNYPTSQNFTPVTTQTTLDLPLANFQLSQAFTAFHPGVDLIAPKHTRVYTVAAGEVTYAGWGLGYGNHVVIRHQSNHFTSLSAHLDQIAVVTGQQISRGELIGTVGNTGWATGNHLHLELYYQDRALNPLEVLPINLKQLAYDPIMSTPSSPENATATPILASNLSPGD